jgi:hypothetical protein
MILFILFSFSNLLAYLMKDISGTRRAHLIWIRRIRDRMVVVFTTTYAISAYHH